MQLAALRQVRISLAYGDADVAPNERIVGRRAPESSELPSLSLQWSRTLA
jgi:hypothetical protein